MTKFSTLLKTRGHAMRNEKKTQKRSGWQAGPDGGSQEGGAGRGGSAGSSAWSASAPGTARHPRPVRGALTALACIWSRAAAARGRNAKHWGPSPPASHPTEPSAEHQRLQCSGPFLGERK